VAIVPYEKSIATWANAAKTAGDRVVQGEGERRHGSTWFVGVDALPNAPDGSVAGVSLLGKWLTYVTPPGQWHRAQLSVVFRGYPKQDPDETDAAHRFRLNRDAAHVDGLLPEGRQKRRFLREPHGFIAGFPLDTVTASPLVVWHGSHLVMKAAFQAAFAGIPAEHCGDVDITEVYQAARRTCFDQCPRFPVTASPGEVILLDRHVLHGVAPWQDDGDAQMRMIAYFRPQIAMSAWL
jgi:hypothetical protein